MASRTRYAALDGWRGIAALGIAAYHFGVANHLYGSPLIRNAGLFVDFFFVLSGFVIAHTYGSRVRTPRDAGLYMVRRFGRLWPLHVFTLFCMIGLEVAKWGVMKKTGLSAGEAPFSDSAAAAAIPAHLLFLQAFGLFSDFTWNGPSWSIGAEFWTYLVFAGVCLTGSVKRLVSIAAVIAGFFVVAAVKGRLGGTYDFGFFRCALGFFTGVLVYDFQARRSPAVLRPTFMEILIVGTMLVFVAADARLEQVAPLASFLALPVFAAMLLVFSQERGAISQWLLTTAVQNLGRWSYSIYMVHFVIITAMNSALRVSDKLLGTSFIASDVLRDGSSPNFRAPLLVGDSMFLVYLAVVIVCASLTWRFIEEPFRVYFNDLARRREKGAAARSQIEAKPQMT